MTKRTKVENFAIIAKIVEKSNHAEKDELTAVMLHEIELYNKSKARKSNKPENKDKADLKGFILETLKEIGTPVTVTELMNANPNLQEYNGNTITNSKITRCLMELMQVEHPLVINFKEKKKSYYQYK